MDLVLVSGHSRVMCYTPLFYWPYDVQWESCDVLYLHASLFQANSSDHLATSHLLTKSS